MSPMTFKDKIEVVKSIASILALIVGGIWSYHLFIKERAHFPHVRIEQKASHITLSEDKNLLCVNIELSNTGNSLLVIKKYLILIQQILPTIEGEALSQVNAALKEKGNKRSVDWYSWPALVVREAMLDNPIELEPGENQVVCFEFAVKSKAEVVRIHSYFRNEKKIKGKDEVGWYVATYYDLRTTHKEGGKSK